MILKTVIIGIGIATNVNANTHESAASYLDQVKKINHSYNSEFLNDSRILGSFRFDLKIGSKIFEDYVSINRTYDEFNNPKLKGTYKVPNFLNHN